MGFKNFPKFPGANGEGQYGTMGMGLGSAAVFMDVISLIGTTLVVDFVEFGSSFLELLDTEKILSIIKAIANANDPLELLVGLRILLCTLSTFI